MTPNERTLTILIQERGRLAVEAMSLNDVEVLTAMPRSSLYAAINSLGLFTEKARSRIVIPDDWTPPPND